MTRYILQRLALLPLLMVIYSFVIFVIIQAPPGDFLTAYVATLASSGSSISADQIAALRHQYGLDQPFVVQYFLWMENLFHGDFGLSLEYQRPNADLISEQIGLTIALALFSFVLTWAISVPAGIYSATHPRSLGDHVLTVINYVGVATPNFMLALILMWVAFAYFDISITGLYSPEFVDAPWSLRAGAGSSGPHLAAGAGAGHRRHRAAQPHHARQPAGRAQQALCRDRARQGHEGMAAGAALSRAAGLQSAGQHHRLVPAGAVLGQPDRGHRHEPAEHRPACCCAR